VDIPFHHDRHVRVLQPLGAGVQSGEDVRHVGDPVLRTGGHPRPVVRQDSGNAHTGGRHILPRCRRERYPSPGGRAGDHRSAGGGVHRGRAPRSGGVLHRPHGVRTAELRGPHDPDGQRGRHGADLLHAGGVDLPAPEQRGGLVAEPRPVRRCRRRPAGSAGNAG